MCHLNHKIARHIVISLISPSEVKNPTSIAIGSFDGIRGHRKLIESVVKENKYTQQLQASGHILEKFFMEKLVFGLISQKKNFQSSKILELNN